MLMDLIYQLSFYKKFQNIFGYFQRGGVQSKVCDGSLQVKLLNVSGSVFLVEDEKKSSDNKAKKHSTLSKLLFYIKLFGSSPIHCQLRTFCKKSFWSFLDGH